MFFLIEMLHYWAKVSLKQDGNIRKCWLKIERTGNFIDIEIMKKLGFISKQLKKLFQLHF